MSAESPSNDPTINAGSHDQRRRRLRVAGGFFAVTVVAGVALGPAIVNYIQDTNTISTELPVAKRDLQAELKDLDLRPIGGQLLESTVIDVGCFAPPYSASSNSNRESYNPSPFDISRWYNSKERYCNAEGTSLYLFKGPHSAAAELALFDKIDDQIDNHLASKYPLQDQYGVPINLPDRNDVARQNFADGSPFYYGSDLYTAPGSDSKEFLASLTLKIDQDATGYRVSFNNSATYLQPVGGSSDDNLHG